MAPVVSAMAMMFRLKNSDVMYSFEKNDSLGQPHFGTEVDHIILYCTVPVFFSKWVLVYPLTPFSPRSFF
jgi:hypothetical protein